MSKGKYKTAAEKAAKMAFNAAQQNEMYLTVSNENMKLQPTKDVKYIIWNLPAMKTCPFSTELCRKNCYAKKAECGARPDVLPSREKHWKESKKDSFVERMIFTIAAHVNRPSFKNAKRIIVRIHESGDFYNRKYAKAWLTIARFFAYDSRVIFMAYTKSVEYFQGLQIPGNMTIRYSLWADTEPAQYKKAVNMGLPVYTAVDHFTTEKNINRCLCENCSTCQKCWHDIEMLMCEIH